jgi:predicted dienelactone hydrolase
MRSSILFLAAFFWVSATAAEAAGLWLIIVPADSEGPAMQGAIWSPCATPPQEVDVDGMALPGVKDCPISGDGLPLVVISHGRTGSFIGHHDTAETLADAGFIVAAINHALLARDLRAILIVVCIKALNPLPGADIYFSNLD